MKIMRSKRGVGLWIALLLFSIMFGNANLAFAEAGDEESPDEYQAATFQIIYRSDAEQGSCNPDDGAFQAWPAEARTAMDHVVDILNDLINSTVPIVVDACYQVDNDPDTLASAGATTLLTQDDVPQLPTANRLYAIALANALSGTDQNGAEVEITASANSAISWDFCTINCSVDANRTDFVSTMVHELLHGLGFSTSFDVSPPPLVGMYSEPPDIMDDLVVRVADNAKLIENNDLPNNSAELLAAMQQGSGTIAFNGANTRGVNGGNNPFIFSPTTYSQGSSMSHWDDDHATNLGRMMNSATGAGPSSRTVDAITLMTLKDIGWSVNEPRDHGNSTHSAYGDAQHINDPAFSGHVRLGNNFTSEGAALPDDGDDGVTKNGTWAVGPNVGAITINMTSSAPLPRGCVSGWIDWDRNNSFANANESILNMQPVGAGNQNFSINVPAVASSNGPYNARFRLIPDWDGDGSCGDQVAINESVGLFGGEVEDYQWLLKPGGTPTLPPGVNPRLYLPTLERQ